MSRDYLIRLRKPVAHAGRPAKHAPSYLGTIKAFGEFLAKLVVRECAVGMRRV